MRYQNIGFIATFTSAISLIPAVYSATIEKSTHGINYLYIFLAICSQLLWLTYGLLNKDLPLIILSSYLLVVFTVLCIFKFYYESKGLDKHSKLEKKHDKCEQKLEEDINFIA